MTASPQTRYDSSGTTFEAPRWRWFWAWAAVGFLIPMTLLGAFTIGLFMIPLFVIGTLVLASRPGARRSVTGLVTGFGTPFLMVAALNHNGPGNVCTTNATSQACLQEWNRWPWLAVGLLFVAGGVVLFTRQREQHRRQLSKPPQPLG
jgi:hypothetical protein